MTFEVEAGFESLFNGQDLTGWGYRPTTEKMKKSAKNWQSRDPNAPPWPIVETAVNFDGETVTPDGRYLAKNGRLVVTTPPEGRKIQQLWTVRRLRRQLQIDPGISGHAERRQRYLHSRAPTAVS